MKEIQIGLKFTVEKAVGETDTALAAGSGNLRVFATPYMAALMENAAYRSILPFLDEGESSVGVSLRLTHSAATPVGLQVRVESEVTAVEGKKLTFSVKAFDETGPIGEAVHERVVVNERRFLEWAYGKLDENYDKL